MVWRCSSGAHFLFQKLIIASAAESISPRWKRQKAASSSVPRRPRESRAPPLCSGAGKLTFACVFVSVISRRSDTKAARLLRLSKLAVRLRGMVRVLVMVVVVGGEETRGHLNAPASPSLTVTRLHPTDV
ncbi:hypothetical protein E2C01_007411 [Portunus trituberculatus]|uniref:Uncharacterized protein n=1 Tax=Portunus trituberculatus TaxID=210409 RepID=A0A5B7CY54_PORTR|nr:hypothetical protein [Portunus trituberculatus]